MFLNRLALMAISLAAPNRTVYPSGALFATLAAPIMPVAPGLFSMTTDWPRNSESFCAMARPVMSSCRRPVGRE